MKPHENPDTAAVDKASDAPPRARSPRCELAFTAASDPFGSTRPRPRCSPVASGRCRTARSRTKARGAACRGRLQIGLASFIIALTALALSGCAHQGGRALGSRPPTNSDPPTRAALLRIAATFNDNYDDGHFGAVWDRWDGRSKAIITRSEYLQRHRLCAPATHAKAVVEGASKQPNGAWHVRYEIEDVQLVDTWYYARHRWVFDIIRSNPRAARQYAMPFGKYAAAVGCSVH